ncbi:MAG: DUF3427 domain-containing protein [Syntrophorhabdaceae bacterium]
MSRNDNENQHLPFGIYEALIDEQLKDALSKNPDLRAVIAKVESEEEPTRYAAFIAKIIEKALKLETNHIERINLCNRLVRILSENQRAFLENHKLIFEEKQILSEITPPHYARSGIPRPETSLAESSLFTGSPREPQLAHELQKEMRSADEVEILISFIKWSGLQLLIPAFEELRGRSVPVRLITTSYMGASDSTAVEWLAAMPNVQVRVSYDTARTRLHAKAYHFQRRSGFSTAYIGSANMSNAAMTSGLEWNLKITAQDMPHILEKFTAEFETYWNSQEFIPFDPQNPQVLRDAIRHARDHDNVPALNIFFDLKPHPFQERILDQLTIERKHGHKKNLIIAATGTGKTVIAAFDFKRFYEQRQKRANLLFVAHRKEILEQAIMTFRNVLRLSDFGDLLVGSCQASRNDHLFCSIEMLNSRQLWNHTGGCFYDFIIIDEVHHGASDSYRAVFNRFEPSILLGLTATPERMDGKSVVVDFNNRFAAEIRLAEALEEKLLCPFHYFGVADPVALDADNFWRNGKYDILELEKVYTGAHVLATQRINAVISALLRYEPDLSRVKGIGFCVSVKHADYMAKMFNQNGIASGVITGETPGEARKDLLQRFRTGELTFIFTRDVFNEGLDVPDINTVVFLRPTESLTIFLQQLGRGLRHAPEKEYVTVLDFVGQAHRRYRIDLKMKTLLPKHRFSIDREVELEFPHLPPGCSIQLDRIAREHVLSNIRENLKHLRIQIPERLKTFENESNLPLNFTNFIRYHDYEPNDLLTKETWTGWKAKAGRCPLPENRDLAHLKSSLIRVLSISGPGEIYRIKQIVDRFAQEDTAGALEIAGNAALAVHYRIWGNTGKHFGMKSLFESFSRVSNNRSIVADLMEIIEFREAQINISGEIPKLPFESGMELHACYGIKDIQANLGKATFSAPGLTGVGVIPFKEIKTYVMLITFQKTEKEFSPRTMYADYPISRDLIHWESQSHTSQKSRTGQNLIHHKEMNYTILIFARDQKQQRNVTVPFTYLGPADLLHYESERPIKVIWKLRHAMPVTMFEENRRGG